MYFKGVRQYAIYVTHFRRKKPGNSNYADNCVKMWFPAFAQGPQLVSQVTENSTNLSDAKRKKLVDPFYANSLHLCYFFGFTAAFGTFLHYFCTFLMVLLFLYVFAPVFVCLFFGLKVGSVQFFLSFCNSDEPAGPSYHGISRVILPGPLKAVG